ncbi:PapD-like protein [Zychaea mexicana]|uniref:PapD-like protein n=1 Tax=Zychaea mexicana TaxID=64656 RepID=UPI0022FDED1A|nr:PapD-like protein [Zychaea mexicana]KAI9492992.1 PapD-like protein [Zychaea mexicana]
MSLVVQPKKTLFFPHPTTNLHEKKSVTITLQNPGNQVVTFKIKTTAPRTYSVRPNIGFLDPLQSRVVQIHFHADQYERRQRDDKFLVLSMSIDYPAHQNIMELHGLWTHVEANDKARISRKRLRCEFLEPGQDATEAQHQAPMYLTDDDVDHALQSGPEFEPEAEILEQQPTTMLAEPAQAPVSLSQVQQARSPIFLHDQGPAAFIEHQAEQPIHSPPPPPQEQQHISARIMQSSSDHHRQLSPIDMHEMDELKQMVNSMNHQMSAYKDELAHLRYRRTQWKPRAQYAAALRPTTTTTRTQPMTTAQYPASAVVIVALLAFALAYLVIHITS